MAFSFVLRFHAPIGALRCPVRNKTLSPIWENQQDVVNVIVTSRSLEWMHLDVLGLFLGFSACRR